LINEILTLYTSISWRVMIGHWSEGISSSSLEKRTV
jgi:hypothetical protein